MSTQNLEISNVDFNELNKYFSEYVEGTDFENVLNVDDNEVNNQDPDHVSRRSDVCQNCGGDKFVEDYSQGIVICTNNTCGEILRSVFDHNPEWKQYDDDDKAGARCTQSHNVLLPQSSLGTSIGGFGKNRIKILHTWAAMPYKERSLNNEFKRIHDVCLKAQILKCVEDDTKIMYKMVSDCKHITGKNIGKYIITRGVNRTSIIAACLFFACIRKGVTRTSKEIAQLWGISDMDMNRGCKNLQKLFKIKNKNSKITMNMGSSKPEHFIRRYCNELKIKNQYIEEALKIAINVEKLNIASGHTPNSSAAASILLMAELNNLTHITKKKLAMEFDVSDATIYRTYKELEPYKYVLTNTETIDEIVKQIKTDIVKQEIPPEVLARMKKFGLDNSNEQKVIPKEDDNSDLELDLDNNYYSESEDETPKKVITKKQKSQSNDDDEAPKKSRDKQQTKSEIEFNENLPKNLKLKHDKINELLNTKSTNDIKKDIEILQKSHNLIKQVTRDLGKYAEHLSMFD